MKNTFTTLLFICTTYLGVAQVAPFLSESKVIRNNSLSFVENKGQIHNPEGKPVPLILYSAHDKNTTMFLKKSGISYIFRKSQDKIEKDDEPKGRSLQQIKGRNSNYIIYRLDIELLNANQNPLVEAENEQQYKENFFTANSGTEGIINARSYKRIVYKDVYPKIDWVVYFKNNQIKYDFIIREGGNPTNIRLKYNGAQAIKLNNDGSLTTTTPLGDVTEEAPYSYEKETGKRIESGFKVENDVVNFTTDKYQGTLVIDPIVDWVVSYDEDGMDASYGIVSDHQGNAYITGATNSLNNIATSGSNQSTYSGGFKDAFIIKIDSAGNKIWGTYFGGDDWDESMSIALDSSSNLYIGGFTKSSNNIATAASYQQTYGGSGDAFLAKFDSAGIRIWSTYFGGSLGPTEGYSVCTDKGANVFLAGQTFAPTGIATPNAYQIANAGDLDGFIVKFNSNGTRLWSTYYGGSNTEYGSGVTCDSFENVYLVGTARSTSNISSNNGYQSSYGGGLYDSYLVKFDSSGTRIWATYYGGNESDYGNAVICDKNNNVFITGETQSTSGIATSGAHQDSFSVGYCNAFIVKFENNGTRSWGTYYGGDGETIGTALAVDYSGNLYCGGRTSSHTNIASSDAFQTSYSGDWDMFMSKFTNNGMREFGTYYGTGLNDLVRSINYNSKGWLYVTGGDLFNKILTIKVGLENKLRIHTVNYTCSSQNSIVTSFFSPGQTDINNIFTIELSDTAGDFSSPTILGTTSFATPIVATIPPGISGLNYRIRARSSAPPLVSDTFDIIIHSLPTPIINSNGSILNTGSFASYQWYLNGGAIVNANDSAHIATQNGSYTVLVSDTNGCSKISDPFPFNATGIENITIANSIKVYPNPTLSTINIDSPIPISSELFTIEGRRILRTKKTKKIEISDYSSGFYLLKISDINGRVIKIEKLIIE